LTTIPSADGGTYSVLVGGDGIVSLVSVTAKGNSSVVDAHVGDGGTHSGNLVTVSCHRILKSKDTFILFQTENGALYRAKTAKGKLTVFKVPCDISPAICLTISSIGLMFIASEAGAGHTLYQFTRVVESGEDGDESCLHTLDVLPNLSNMTDFMVNNLMQSSASSCPQVFCVSGKGAHSSLTTLQNGTSVTEVAHASIAPLGKNDSAMDVVASTSSDSSSSSTPTGIWSLKSSTNHAYDRYLVVSFSNSTTLLEVNEDGSISVAKPGQHHLLQYLHTKKQTIECVLLADGAVLQVHKTGIVHIPPNDEGTQWDAPNMTMIQCARGNAMQMVISLTGGDVRYFQLTDGQLLESGTEPLDKDATCLDMSAPSRDGLSHYLAVGCVDDTVQLLSLQSTTMLAKLSIAKFNYRPSSVCFSHQPPSSSSGSDGTLLHVGCENGELARISVMSSAGALAIVHQQLLGHVPVRLVRVMSRGASAVLAMCTKTILIGSSNLQQDDASSGGLLRAGDSTIPVEAFESACSLTSSLYPEALVLLSKTSFKVVTLDGHNQVFSRAVMSLPRTPRKIAAIPKSRYCVVLLSQHSIAAANDPSSNSMDQDGDDDDDDDNDGDDQDEDDQNQEGQSSDERRHTQRPWESTLELIEPLSGRHVKSLPLGDNCAALTLSVIESAAVADTALVVVGCAQDLDMMTRTGKRYVLKVFAAADCKKNCTLKPLYETEIERFPTAMSNCNGRLAVGMGSVLRIYDISHKALLRVCDFAGFPSTSPISRIASQDNRIFVGHLSNSISILRMNDRSHMMELLASDTSHPRFITALASLSRSVVCGGDMFGNVFVMNIPESVEDASAAKQSTGGGAEAVAIVDGATSKDNASGGRVHSAVGSGGHGDDRTEDLVGLVNDRVWNQGEVTLRSHFYLGGAVTGVVPCNLGYCTQSVVLVGSLNGSISAIFPMGNSDDASFLQQLQNAMTVEMDTTRNICGRNHRSYRSIFEPTKGTIDGDVCMLYCRLNDEEKSRVAANFEKSALEVTDRLRKTMRGML
jgi:splicing factor 3B subunit 3